MIAQPRCGREVWKPQRRRLLRADCVDSYSLVLLPSDFFCLVLALSTSLRAKRSNPFFLYTVRWIASLRSQCRMTVGAPERLVNRRLLHRLAKSGLQKIEVAAFIGLLDVAGEHPAVAALIAWLRRLPCGAALCELRLRHIEIDRAGADIERDLVAV